MTGLISRIQSVSNYLRAGTPTSRTRATTSRRFIPRLEQLEDRDTPSVATINILAQPLTAGDTAPFSPQEIRAAYGVNQITLAAGITGDGTGQTIAIVDAYNDPDAQTDLQTFDAHFSLPNPPSFTVVNQSGVAGSYPHTDPTGGWELEESLDIEWSHAIAPNANIILVEANSSVGNNLYLAAQTAAALPGVSVVSMSWGSKESSSELKEDSIFDKTGVTFVASTGDSGAPGGYPADSPNVVAAGGTSLTLTNGDQYSSETAWIDSGGGKSLFESRPSFQNSVKSVVGNSRGIPDVAFDANPTTGVAVYDSYRSILNGGAWVQVGGTSVSSPCWAGLIAIADQGRVLETKGTLSSAQTLSALYSLPAADFHDITTGSNGTYKALPGYDLVTGLGSPVANLLVPGLANSAAVAGVATPDSDTKVLSAFLTSPVNPLGGAAAPPAFVVNGAAGGSMAPAPSGAGVWVYSHAPAQATDVGSSGATAKTTPDVNHTESVATSVPPAVSVATDGDTSE